MADEKEFEQVALALTLSFIAALADAGVALGLPGEESAKLALATVKGAAAMAEGRSLRGIGQLRKDVASPGGTTEAGLAVLMGGDALEDLVEEAVASRFDARPSPKRRS